MSTVTLETLKDAILSVGLNEPWPVAIWFVDRYAEYLRVLKHYSKDIPKDSFKFAPQGATEAELARRPEFCSTPGVWLEMSNGAYVQLDKEVTK